MSLYFSFKKCCVLSFSPFLTRVEHIYMLAEMEKLDIFQNCVTLQPMRQEYP